MMEPMEGTEPDAGARATGGGAGWESPGALAEAVASTDLLRNLVLRELRATYKGSALGVLWSLFNPLVTMAIFTLVFGVFLKVQLPVGAGSVQSFPAFLLVGLLPWNFLSLSMNTGAQSLVTNGNLIRKVYFFRAVLPISTVLAHGVHFAIEMGLLFVFLAVLGVSFWPNLWLLVVPLGSLLLLAFGVAFITAVANVYYRDTQHLASLFSMAWFYATPIVYPVEAVRDAGEPWITLCRLNPAAVVVGAFRTILYEGQAPDAASLVSCVVSSGAIFLLGWTVFRRAEPRLAEEV
jgi:lipopolysaccharide transport system permease protein